MCAGLSLLYVIISSLYDLHISFFSQAGLFLNSEFRSCLTKSLWKGSGLMKNLTLCTGPRLPLYSLLRDFTSS